MSIIKHGLTYGEVICKKCCCVYSYVDNNIKKESGIEGYFGEIHLKNIQSVSCPECGKKHYILVEIDGKNSTNEWNGEI